MAFDTSKAKSALVTSGETAATKVHIREAFPIDDRFMRVVAVASAGATKEQVFNGIKAQFKGITPIHGSFVSLAAEPTLHHFEGIVGVVSERVVVNDANRENFKAVAANMYMDQSENLWTLRKTATGEVMVKSVCADDTLVMQQLLACATHDHNDFNNKNLHLESSAHRAMVQGGDLIAYVSQQSCDLQMGIACASIDNEDGSPTTDIYVTRPNGASETVHREMIVVTAGTVDLEDEEAKDANEIATASAADVDRFASFYSRVFARRPAFFDDFMTRVRSYVFF
uniref:Uncharacterized protein n=1 Tax=Pseudomonas phage HRDY3 TaxID=3236930 RepID=A0AB39CE31_9VIRU